MIKIKTKIVALCVGFMLLVCLGGCNDPSRLKGLVPAEGIVYYDDAPLAGAVVKFFPQDASGRTATSMTDDSGKFIMMTLNPKDGVAPGEYNVTVVKNVNDASPSADDSDEGIDDPDGRAAALRMQERARSKDSLRSLLPNKYGSPAQSGLKADIGAKGEKNLEFRLSK